MDVNKAVDLLIKEGAIVERPLSETVDFLKKNGCEVLNENEMAKYLMDRVYQVATEIYAREIDENVPDLDGSNQPSREYLERFDYLSDNLKNAVKRASVALQNDLKSQGIDINIQNIQNEIYGALKLYSK